GRIPGGDLGAVLVERVAAADLAGLAGVGNVEAVAEVPGLVVAERGQVEAEGVPGAGGRGVYRVSHEGRSGAREADVGARVQRVGVPVLGQVLVGVQRPERAGLPARGLPVANGPVFEILGPPQHGRARGDVLYQPGGQPHGEDASRGEADADLVRGSADSVPALRRATCLNGAFGNGGKVSGMDYKVLGGDGPGRPGEAQGVAVGNFLPGR